MDSNEIKAILSGRTAKEKHIKEQDAYARGFNVAINADPAREDPDNRIPVPFIRKAVMLVSGYMFKAGNITYSDGEGGTFISEYLQDIYNKNEEELVNSLLGEKVLAHGDAYCLHWIDESGAEKFWPIHNQAGIPLYSDEIKPRLVGFIHYRVDSSGAILVDYYDDTIKQEWKREKEKDDFAFISEKVHGYGVVPVDVFQMSPDGENLFDCVLDLQDFMDKLLSQNFANELGKLADAILLLASAVNTETKDSAGLTDADKLDRAKYIDRLGENVQGKVAYLTKNLTGEFQEKTYNITSKLINDMLLIFDPTSPDFTQASGVAQAYKLLAFNYLCTRIENNFLRGLYERLNLEASLAKNLSRGDWTDEVSSVQIHWMKNLPFDLVNLAQVAAMLKGLIPDSAILNMFPTTILPDKDAALKELENKSDFEDTPEDSIEDSIE